MRKLFFSVGLLVVCLLGCDHLDEFTSSKKDEKVIVHRDVNQCKECADYALKQEKKTYKLSLKEMEATHKQNVATMKAQKKACIILPMETLPPVELGNIPPTDIVIVPPDTTITVTDGPVFSDATADLTTEEKVTVQAIGSDRTTPDIRNRVVCLGDNFPDTPAKLNFCVFDMQKSAVRHFEKLGFKKEEIRIITNKELTAAGVKKWIAWACANTQSGDKRGVFMSMHGAEDTDATGKIMQILVTYDMVSTGNWSPETEVEPGWITTQIQTVVDGCSFLLVMDLCHAGGVRPFLKITKTAKSIDGPDYVQKRVTSATQYSKAFASIDSLNCTVIPMCGAGQLSEESSATGGAGTWAFWRAVEKLGPNARAVDIVKEMRIDLRANGFSQTPECHGKYALKGIYQTN